jgi:hypothetical protein
VRTPELDVIAESQGDVFGEIRDLVHLSDASGLILINVIQLATHGENRLLAPF